ncbi:hypothetical protein EYC80_003313 [Monilinia laxa]|uniref:Rhodopsin domain-containing protein n=2 Tax=Monilinia laxa TaxID=61186 RepID=A0A5N6KDH9_MONLA|nr:hypothetical protein EYC80_003313 [Monilinia laxa]
MQQPPAWVVASWPKPNYINPETHGWENVILNVVLYTILCCFLVLRIWTRTRLRASFGADDVMILLAMVPTTAFFVLSLLADLKFMWTRHQYDIPLSHVEFGLKMVLIIEVMFAAACTFTKLSMLMLVRRMLTSASMFWRRVTLAAICIVGLQGGLFCIVLVFQCRPPQDYWRLTLDPQPNCIDQSSTLLLAGVVNTLTDFLVVILPIRTVYSTNLPRRQQFLVSLLFILGLLSCFAGIVRTYYMYVVTQVWDQVWASYPVWISAAVELYIGIICTSIPATKAFFVTYIPKLFSSHTSRTTRTDTDHHPNYNPYFNSKGDPIPYPGFGITSTSKSHPRTLTRESSMTPLNAENSLHDNTVGTSILELASITNTIRGNSNEKHDEEMEIGMVVGTPPSPSFDGRINSHDNSSKPRNSSIPRRIIGSVRRDRGRTRDRDGYGETTASEESSGHTRSMEKEREREKEGGWDIHIGVVKTIEVEEEHIEEEIRDYDTHM